MIVKYKNFRPDKVVHVPEFLFSAPKHRLPMGVMLNHVHWCLDDFWNKNTIIVGKRAK